jgi:hypothetical protein
MREEAGAGLKTETGLIAGCNTATTSSIVFHFLVMCNPEAKTADFIPRDVCKNAGPMLTSSSLPAGNALNAIRTTPS